MPDGFVGKAIFVWNDSKIGNPAVVAARLKGAGFECAYLHSVYLSTWRTSSRVALVTELKAVGIKVFASCGVYGDKPAQEGQQAAKIVNDYHLDGFIFDAESTFDGQPTPDSNAVHMITAYKAATSKPCAWCWWAFHKYTVSGKPLHPVKILQVAMQYADYGMPMIYWSWGDDPDNAIRYLNASISQWREVTQKPLIIAGRAYIGNEGTAKPEAISAFDARCRQLNGVASTTWWSMEHAVDNVNVPGVWAALAALPGWIGSDEEKPVENVNIYKTYAVGQYVTNETQLTNPDLAFVVGNAGDVTNGPNSRLKPIELKAASMGMHFIPLWNLDISWYEDTQKTPGPAWPTIAGDVPLQAFIAALQNRSFRACIIRVMDDKMTNGEPHGKVYLDYAVHRFVERASDWLWREKKAILIFQSSYDEFIQPYAPTIYDWCGYWDSCIEQYTTSVANLDESYPKASDKPRFHIGEYEPGKSRWRFWYYFNGTVDLYLFNGNKAQLASFLDVAVPENPADTTKPSVPQNLTVSVSGSTVVLTWAPATDNVGVDGYHVYRGGVMVGSVKSPAFTDATMQPGSYSYQVMAYDAVGNASALSTAVTAVVTANNPDTPVDLSAVLAILGRMEAAQAALAQEVHEIRGVFKP